MELKPRPEDLYVAPLQVRMRPRDDVEPGMWQAQMVIGGADGTDHVAEAWGYGGQRAMALLMQQVAGHILRGHPPVRVPFDEQPKQFAHVGEAPAERPALKSIH